MPGWHFFMMPSWFSWHIFLLPAFLQPISRHLLYVTTVQCQKPWWWIDNSIYSCFGWPWNDRSEIDKFFCRECFDNHVICHIIYTMYLMLCHIHMLLSFKREPIWLVGFERGMLVQWVLLLCQQKPSGASTKAPWQRFQMGTGHPKNDMVNLLTIAQNCGLPGLKLKILIPSCANMVGFLPQGWVKIVPHDCPLVLVKRHPSTARDLAFDSIHVYPAIGYGWRLITHVKLLCLSMTHSCTSLLLMVRYTHIPWQPMICAHHNIFHFLGGQGGFPWCMYIITFFAVFVCSILVGI
jgi:hypothetical protein